MVNIDSDSIYPQAKTDAERMADKFEREERGHVRREQQRRHAHRMALWTLVTLMIGGLIMYFVSTPDNLVAAGLIAFPVGLACMAMIIATVRAYRDLR